MAKEGNSNESLRCNTMQYYVTASHLLQSHGIRVKNFRDPSSKTSPPHTTWFSLPSLLSRCCFFCLSLGILTDDSVHGDQRQRRSQEYEQRNNFEFDLGLKLCGGGGKGDLLPSQETPLPFPTHKPRLSEAIGDHNDVTQAGRAVPLGQYLPL